MAIEVVVMLKELIILQKSLSGNANAFDATENYEVFAGLIVFKF